jgi:hypothetical protein
VELKMTNSVLLNNIDHQDLKVITERSPTYGDNLWYAQTFPMEFKSIQAYYPILFNKDPNTGKFFPLALFGFENDENLFLSDNKWTADYIPATVARQPFLIGIQTLNEEGIEKKQRMLQIDLDNPRVNQTQGESLFLAHGGSTPYLDKVADLLEAIHHGINDSNDFIDALIEHQLLESVTLDITLNDHSKHQMLGFYTINEDKLNELSSDILMSLHKKGHLQAIYMTIASQANVRKLISKKNEQLGL